MAMHRGGKPPDQDHHRRERKHGGQDMARAGAGPSLRQAEGASRMRSHRAARAGRGELLDARSGLASLGLELENRAGRVDTADFPAAANPLGLELEGGERRVGTYPGLRPMDLISDGSPPQVQAKLASRPGQPPRMRERSRRAVSQAQATPCRISTGSSIHSDITT